MNLLTKICTTSLFSSAIFTLVMSPVALGAQAEKQKQEIDSIILAAGLNKPQTYESFWNANKGDFHGQVYKPLKDYFAKYPNAKMPTFKTVQAKNSLGETVNNIEMTLDGKTISFQYIGEKDKFLKYKSIYLSESDLINFNQALGKMIKVDPEFYKEFNQSFKSTEAEIKFMQDKNSDAQYEGMPRVSKETWTKMSQVDRAHYLINLRSYWTDSLNVLRQIEKNEQRLRGVKTKTSRYDYLMKFVQNEATAQNSSADVPPPPGGSSGSSASSSSMEGFRNNKPQAPWGSSASSNADSVKTLDSQGYLNVPTIDMSTFVDTGTSKQSGQQTNSKTPGNQNCVIHGVISRYAGQSCTKDIKTLKEFYSPTNDKEIFSAIETCEKQNPTMMACNPYLYGYQTPGQPHCVKYDKNVNSDYQKATHADGPCEKASPLGNPLAKENLNGTDFLKKDIKGPGRYAADNLKMSAEDLENLYKKQQAENDKYVTDYLKNFLGDDVDKIKKGVALDNSLIEKLSNIQNVFDSQIKFARESCIKSNENPKYKQYDKNFWGACDQLQRRHLFVAQWLQQKVGCDGNGKIDEKTLKCFCPPTGAIKVNPGEKCAARPVAPGGSSGSTPPPVVQKVDCEAADQFPGAGAVADEKGLCKCPSDGKTPHKLTNSYRGNKYSCESGDFNWTPLLWIGGILGGAFLLSKLWPKKKKIQPPADTCKLTPNCVPQCKTNEYLNPDANNGQGACWPKTEGGTGTNTTDTNAGGIPTSGSTGN